MNAGNTTFEEQVKKVLVYHIQLTKNLINLMEKYDKKLTATLEEQQNCILTNQEAVLLLLEKKTL